MLETKKLPPTVNLYITSECQLRCAHCFFAQTGVLGKGHLSFTTLKNVIDQLANGKVILSAVSGGDPLLHPDFEKIINYLRLKKIGPLIGITGVDVTIDQILMLKRLSISNVQLSLDGSQKDTDFLRGSGVHKRVLKSIDLLQKNKIKCSVAFCIHKLNADNALNECELLINKYKIDSIKIQLLRSENTNLKSIENNKLQIILKKISDINEKYKKNIMKIPGYKFNINQKIFEKDQYRYPSIIIQFDGTVRSGENGPIICTVDDDIVGSVNKYIHDSKVNFIINKIKETTEEFNILITRVPRHKISASALVFSLNNRNYVFVDEQFSHLEQLFLLLHECAHLSNETILMSPRSHNYNEKIEYQANIWALERMSSYMSKDILFKLNKFAKENEDLILPTLKEYGLGSLHSYWEKNNNDILSISK